MTNTIQNIIHQAMVSQFMLEDVASQIIVKYNENSGGYACSFVLGSKTAFMGELIIIGAGYLDESNSQLSSKARSAFYNCIPQLVMHTKMFKTTEERVDAIKNYIQSEVIN